MWWYSGRLLTPDLQRLCPSSQKSEMKNLKGSTEQRGWQREDFPSFPPTHHSKATFMCLHKITFFPSSSSWENLLRAHSDSAAPRVRELREWHGTSWEDEASSACSPERCVSSQSQAGPLHKTAGLLAAPSHARVFLITFHPKFTLDAHMRKIRATWERPYFEIFPPGIFLNTPYASYYWEIMLFGNEMDINTCSRLYLTSLFSAHLNRTTARGNMWASASASRLGYKCNWHLGLALMFVITAHKLRHGYLWDTANFILSRLEKKLVLPRAQKKDRGLSSVTGSQ